MTKLTVQLLKKDGELVYITLKGKKVVLLEQQGDTFKRVKAIMPLSSEDYSVEEKTWN